MTGRRASPAPKVLIVDDDTSFSHSMRRILTGAGYDCSAVANGAAARQQLGQGDIAAVLCDITMPGESGLDLLATLAADFPEVAVVMTTGVDDPATAARAYDIGAYGYLIKPFTVNEVRITLDGALRRSQLEAARRDHLGGLERTVARLRRVHSAEETEAIMAAYPDRAGQPNTRMLVVDDDETFVDSLLLLLGAEPSITIAGTASTGAEAERLAKACEPDVVLIDFDFLNGEGGRLTEALRALVPGAQLLVLTDHALPVGAFGSGAGLVGKTATAEVQGEAIHYVREGEAASSAISGPRLAVQCRPSSGVGSDLGPRELEVLRLMAAGEPNKALAAELHLSLNTIRNHVQNILYKLDAHSKLEAVATAVRAGLIERDAQGARADGPPSPAARLPTQPR